MTGNPSKRYPIELKTLVVRMYDKMRPDNESDWVTMGRAGVGTAETVRTWVRQDEMDAGQRLALKQEVITGTSHGPIPVKVEYL